jgi:hypothetical protein
LANREVYPSSLFPLNGDLSAGAGAISVEVIGLQNTLFSEPPTINGTSPTYNAATGEIDWDAPSGNAVQINGVGVSADKQIFINGVSDGSAPTWTIEINGTPDGG